MFKIICLLLNDPKVNSELKQELFINAQKAHMEVGAHNEQIGH